MSATTAFPGESAPHRPCERPRAPHRGERGCEGLRAACLPPRQPAQRQGADACGRLDRLGPNIYQRPKDSSAAQHWFFAAEGAGRYSFRNRHSNLCMHPSNWRPVSGTYLLQASCTGANDARMWSAAYASGSYVFRSVKTGLYMDVVLSSTATNANAVQASLDSSASQHWRLEYAGDF